MQTDLCASEYLLILFGIYIEYTLLGVLTKSSIQSSIQSLISVTGVFGGHVYEKEAGHFGAILIIDSH